MRINLCSNVHLHNQTFILEEHKDTKDGGVEEGWRVGRMDGGGRVCVKKGVKQREMSLTAFAGALT